MAKPTRRTYTAAEKSALVAEFERIYKAGGRTYASVARELGIGDSTYHFWVGQGVKPAPQAARPVEKSRAASPPDERARLVAEVENLHAAGRSIKAACRVVGIADKTFRNWRARHQPLPAMRPVEITALVPAIPPALPREAADSASAPLTLVTPGGYKLEGLDLAGAAFLLRQLA